MNVVDEIQCSTRDLSTQHCAVETNWKRAELSDFFLVAVAARMLLENVNESLHRCRHRRSSLLFFHRLFFRKVTAVVLKGFQ